MARTFRNRPFKTVADTSDALYWLETKTEAEVMKMIYQLYLDSHSGAYNTAKAIRRTVEKTRRAKNKQEVYRAVNLENYTPNMQPCNCKDDQRHFYS